ncbi:MAG: winged helix-turn-helix domain-containing protein, partial [Anaerolineae bacterium]|nr:winged helix-turn-helix domain-containing protein [Anaerolineae bacterium]
DIAGLIGATRERVNQVMVTYKRENIISVDRKYRVIIHNKDALSERCS